MVALARLVVAVQRSRAALVDRLKPVLQAMELVRTGPDAHARGQRAPALAVAAFPFLANVTTGAADDLRDGTGIVHVARRPPLLHQEPGDVVAWRTVVAHEFVDERITVPAAIGIDVAQ